MIIIINCRPCSSCSLEFVHLCAHLIKLFSLIFLSSALIFISESDFDYIQILNNGIIGQARFSGSQYPFQFISKRSHLEMLFRTDKLIQLRGFWLSVVPTMEKGMLNL